MNNRQFLLHGWLVFSFVGSVPLALADAQESVSGTVEFSEVRSVLRKRCLTCHNIDEARGDLDLSSMASIEAGSGSGPVIVPGKPNASLLYTVAAHLEEPVMPPNNPKLPGRELDLIKRWIEGIVPPVEATSIALKEGTAAAGMSASVENSAATADDVSNKAAFEEGGVSIRPLLRATAVTALAVHPSRPIFVTSGRGQAVLGDFESGEWLGAINFPFGEVTSLKFSGDGETLLIAGGVAGLSGTVLGVDAQTWQRKFQLADEVDTISALDMSEDGHLLAVGGPTKVVRIYSIVSGEVIHTLRKHTDWVMSLAFSPDGLLLASGDRFGGVFVWSSDDGELFHTLPGHQGSVSAIAWNSGSETLLTGCEDGKLRDWNLHHGDLVAAWDGQVGPILSIAHASDNTTLVGGRKHKASFWSGTEIQKNAVKAADQVVQVGLSGGGKLGIIGDSVGNIHIVSSESGERVREMNLPVSDDEAAQLLSRLETMEDEFLAKVELERESTKADETTQPVTDMKDALATGSRKVQDFDSETAASLLERVEAVHGSLVGTLRAQEQMAARLTTLRQTVEGALESLVAAEQAGQQVLKSQTQVIEESKRQFDELRTILGSRVTREYLTGRLQAEVALADSAEELLEAVAGQPHLIGSEELELLQTLKRSLLRRTEATRSAMESVD